MGRAGVKPSLVNTGASSAFVPDVNEGTDTFKGRMVVLQSSLNQKCVADSFGRSTDVGPF